MEATQGSDALLKEDFEKVQENLNKKLTEEKKLKGKL